MIGPWELRIIRAEHPTRGGRPAQPPPGPDRLGACSIELAAGVGGTGAHYTRCLSAGCTENTMLSGWNNTVSSGAGARIARTTDPRR
jgi:hypothetical protein